MLRRRAIIPVLIASLVFASLIAPVFVIIPVAAQDGGQQSSNLTQNKLWALGEPLGLFGPFNYSDGVASGRFVQFTYSESESTFLNYSVSNETDNATVFSEIFFSGLESNPDISVNGPLMQIVGNTTAVLVHNNPTGLMQVVSAQQGDEVSLVLADGMSLVENQPTGVTTLNVTGNGMNGTMLIYNGTASQVPGNTTEPATVLVTFDQEGAMQLRFSPKIGSMNATNEEAIQASFSRADLAGEAWVTINGSNYIYEDATINGLTPHVESATAGELRMQLNNTPSDNRGKLVLINLDNKVIDPNKNFSVVLNNETISNASSLEAVVSAVNSTEGNASYYATSVGNLTKYLIFLPNLGENNSLVITSNSSSGGSSLIIYGLIPSSLLAVGLLSAASKSSGLGGKRPRKERH